MWEVNKIQLYFTNTDPLHNATIDNGTVSVDGPDAKKIHSQFERAYRCDSDASMPLQLTGQNKTSANMHFHNFIIQAFEFRDGGSLNRDSKFLSKCCGFFIYHMTVT